MIFIRLEGRSNQIQIKNDKGRLSREDIDRMVRDAERFKADDERKRENVSARNRLEGYIFSVKQAVNDAKSLDANDKKTVEDACEKELKWLDANQMADKEEYEFHYNELSRKCSPIMSRLHRGGAHTRNGPTVEEVD